MPDYLEVVIDKFSFKVAVDRSYNEQGLWLHAFDGGVRVGLSDFEQQRIGDVAFVEVEPAGSVLTAGDELASIETVKTSVSLQSPIGGKVVEVNELLESAPELINEDPYGQGWIAVLEPTAWETERDQLLNAEAYFKVMQGEAQRGGEPA